MFPVLMVFVVAASACSIPRLADYQRTAQALPQTSFLYAADGSLITRLHAAQDRILLRYSQMPESIKEAVVAVEDRRFWSHHGVDVRGVLRAAAQNAENGTVVQGGSTITQQLIKNLYLSNTQTLARKVDEAILAWQLEDQLSKEQILTKYLNTVYFGAGAYGIQAAAQTYFGVDARDLTLTESATLAGLIAVPNTYDPFSHPNRARARRDLVLQDMADQGMISESKLRAASNGRIDLHRTSAQDRYPYPYFVDYFKQWFLSNPAFGADRAARNTLLFTGGLRITTSIDPKLQTDAEQAVRSILPYPSDPAAAMTVIDPRTGYVRAMVGGKDSEYWDPHSTSGRLNLATGGSTGRQAGSSFKPFALVTALEQGMTPSTVFSAPSSIDIPLDAGQVWHVTNAEGSGYGSMSLESATVNSVNTVYAQVIEQVGPQNVIDTAKKMGIRCCPRTTEPKHQLQPYVSSVLGTNEVNTLEMASAYGTFATGGRHAQPVPAVRITDARGKVIWSAKPQPKLVVDPRIISVADGILQKVVLYGTGTAANIGRPQIGKTGTNQNYSDAWFAGAVPQLSAVVWVGFPQGQVSMAPPTTRITVFGGTWPAEIWHAFMARATATMPVRSFPSPSVQYVSVAVDITQAPYCLPNDFTLEANIRTLQFIRGVEPHKTCTTPTSSRQAVVPSVIGHSQASATAILERVGFNVEVVVSPSSQPAGSVIAQSPSAGTSLYQTSTVTITVSEAPPAH
ncbi:MAG: penicillin-binding protein [Actinomycetota bacterium]|jgi:penicillin-binding protein 1A|nr:penicillin-binding protein [Actinomycetota bacterium]